MKKLNFKQWYAIIFLVVFVVYGWLYLTENRYQNVQWGGNAGVLDTWTKTLKGPEYFLE